MMRRVYNKDYRSESGHCAIYTRMSVAYRREEGSLLIIIERNEQKETC